MAETMLKRVASILREPYDAWTAEEVLAYFQTRRGITYFPALDPEHSSPEQISGVLNNCFCFNGERYQLPVAFAWTQNPSPDREWLIFLHKFYYAVGLGKLYHTSQDRRYLDKWIELTTSWINAVPLGFLSSDVMGRRVQNWVFAYYYFVSQSPHSTLSAEFHLSFLESLHSQVPYLCEHLTPARNHRTIELYAIFLVAVVFPEMRDAGEWLAYSRQLLLENLQSDLLDDGVHCELSTDYHHLVLRNYLGIMKLAWLNQIDMPRQMHLLLQKALEFAKYVHKPDGTIPALSDGDARSFRELLTQGYELYGDEELLYVATQGQQGRGPRFRSRLFPAGGYVFLRSGWGNGDDPFVNQRYLVFDCGPLGAGNHGHLDLLSFEMAAYGKSLVVDPGRYSYYEPESGSNEINWRARFRGTGYHNTVLVDNKNQTRYEFQKTRFKICGPAPEYELKDAIFNGEYDFLHGIARSHEYPIIHERQILFAQQSYWIITDILRPNQQTQDKGGATHIFDLRFHLSDEAYSKVKTQVVDEAATIDAPHLVMIHHARARQSQLPLEPVIEEGYISRTYGIKHSAPIVRFTYENDSALLHTILYPYQTERPNITLEILPVYYQGELCTPLDAYALKITVQQSQHTYIDTCFCANSTEKRTYSFADTLCDRSLLFRRHQEAIERSAAQ